ncbi:efflux transporter outer membrane subunit [Sphingomonas koreensis]|nr:efflux transporter outer membrane subunit [Sphingomonas koreensis]
MRPTSMVAAALLGVVLSGCAGPRIETAAVPPVIAPPAWRTDAGATSPIGEAWWQSFGDPVLTALVNKALANNTDLAISAARVREMRASLALARAQLSPAIDAGVSGSRSRFVNAFGMPSEQDAGQPQVQVAYEVDLFGRLSDQKAAARYGYLASQAGQAALRLSVAAAAASGYVTLLGLDARLEVARAAVHSRGDALQIAASRVQHGYSPKLELAQAQAEYDAAAQIVPALQLAIARTEDALSLLTGETPATVTRGQNLESLVVPAIPAGLPSELLRRRPDVAQAELTLAATDKSLAAARKRFLPQVRLSGAAGAAFSTLLKDPVSIWAVGGSILAPLFDGGRLRAQAEAAAAQRDQAAFAYRRTALIAFREVEDALAAAQRLDEQIAALRLQRDALAEGVRLATSRYREGYSPYLEQLDAQRGLLSAQLALAQLRSDALVARIQLVQAMGGGFASEETGAS